MNNEDVMKMIVIMKKWERNEWNERNDEMKKKWQYRMKMK